jgi:putative transcriptional regulator
MRLLIFFLLSIMVSTTVHAEGFLLIAKSHSRDPNFARSVVLVTPYGLGGSSVGLILNRPLNIPIEKILRQLPSLQENRHLLYFGGPVSPDSVVILFRYNKKLPRSLHIVDDIYMSSHLSLLAELVEQGVNSTSDLRVFLGYSGWARGQLAGELNRGNWHHRQIENGRLLMRKDVKGLWEELSGEPQGNWVRREWNSRDTACLMATN